MVGIGARTILFPADILHRLSLHAERRRVSANELARQIVETAVDAGLVDAILDDEAGP